MNQRTRSIVLWAISGLLAVGYLLAGMSKVFLDPANAARQFETFGLPAGMATFIGVCEMAGAVGLLVPRLAGLAASGLVVIMLGAVYSHVTHDPVLFALPAFAMGGLCAYVAGSRGLPFRRSAAGSPPDRR
jgi:uncharacterized membrane protein YphA (DoxX/SURF4 family)